MTEATPTRAGALELQGEHLLFLHKETRRRREGNATRQALAEQSGYGYGFLGASASPVKTPLR